MVAKVSWQPSASLENLRIRAKVLAIIRDFFAKRNILEVETPLLAHFGVTDPHINTVSVVLNSNKQYYLQTSPEYCMKRLLAAGSGAIYQITKAFRDDDVGSLHNPEFTMLEWYRPGFNHLQLMAEVNDLLQAILPLQTANLVSYKELFQRYLAIDPHATNLAELRALSESKNFNCSKTFRQEAMVDDWLQVLFSQYIEPKLSGRSPWFVYNYPRSQAALAKVAVTEEGEIAERFEVYLQGIELANGYHELTEVEQQLARFKQDQQIRAQLHKPAMAIDGRLIAALAAGLPACAGVALGIDRLVMLASKVESIKQVMAFPLEYA